MKTWVLQLTQHEDGDDQRRPPWKHQTPNEHDDHDNDVRDLTLATTYITWQWWWSKRTTMRTPKTQWTWWWSWQSGEDSTLATTYTTWWWWWSKRITMKAPKTQWTWWSWQSSEDLTPTIYTTWWWWQLSENCHESTNEHDNQVKRRLLQPWKHDNGADQMKILVLVVQILARKMKKTKTDTTGTRFARRRIETTKKSNWAPNS